MIPVSVLVGVTSESLALAVQYDVMVCVVDTLQFQAVDCLLVSWLGSG